MRFIETIKIDNGTICNLDLHKERAMETIRHHFGIIYTPAFELLVPENIYQSKGVFKMRVLYSKDIEEFSLEPYFPRVIKKLKMVEGGKIEYGFKMEERSSIERLLRFKEDCDDIIIIKDGYVTDTSYSNIVLSKGGELYTPSTFLLNGTKRRRLIMSGLVKERDIMVRDIYNYDSLSLINAMLDPLFNHPYSPIVVE